MELELDFTAFKKNLRDLIESRGLYAKDIAAEINVSTPTLSRYLQGVREPELKYVVRLARYFGVSVDWLLGLSNDRYEAVPTEVRELPLCTLWPRRMTAPSSKPYSKNIERRTNHDLRQRLGTFCLLCRNRLGG